MLNTSRISSIDLLRGAVMIIMALDHTRDFFHSEAFVEDPLNLQTTTPLLFFTRWITHFCAPVFVFLSGTSAYLQGLRKNKNELAGFLIKRGLWLIVVELLIITLGITFNLSYSVLIFQVIWAIGISMVILGLLVRLPFTVIFLLGLAILLGHNLLDHYEQGKESFPVWYHFLHRPTYYPITKGFGLEIFYPFLPWAGIMMLGYSFGTLYKPEVINRNRKIVLIGLAAVTLFIVLRFLNIYGDPSPWSPQKNMLYTIFSFIKTQKYPPSLLFACMTLGPAIIVLGIVGEVRSRFTNIIITYGRVPFFYYVIHFYVLHTLCVIMFLARGHTVPEGQSEFIIKFIIPGEGYGLGIVYLIWILLVAGLYPLCRWYEQYKRNHRHWWLSYL